MNHGSRQPMPLERALAELGAVAPSREVSELAERLLAESPAERQALLASQPAKARLPLLSILLERSWQARRESPSLCRRWAELGAELAERPGLGLEEKLLADVRAEVYGLLGNGYRLEESYRAAERAFASAERWRRRGSREPLLRARLQSLLGSLCRDVRRLNEAIQVSERAEHTFRRLRETPLAERERIKRIWALYNQGRVQEALELSLDLASQLDWHSENPAALALVHNLVGYFVDLGFARHALSLFERAQPLYSEREDPLTHLRKEWLGGRILAGLREWYPAETCLDGVRQEFVARELAYDASLVTLDLAQVYAEQGKSWRVKQLAECMVSVFEAKGVRREATAALMLFYDAARRERVDALLLKDVSARLKTLPRHA